MKKRVLLIAIIAIVAMIGTVAFVACDKEKSNNPLVPPEPATYRFVMPDGTPALAGASFLGGLNVEGENGIHRVNGEIVAATSIQTEMGGEKADILIAPTNLGATLIKRGAPYKLVSVAVEGSLYIIGNPDKVDGRTEITLNDLRGKRIASIGQNNTPDKVFRYIIDHTDVIDYSDFEVEFVADGPAAKVALMRENNPCDFALVGEPAATAFGTPNGGGFSARLDLQTLWHGVGNELNFPQASLFVKTALANDTQFINQLLAALNANVDWVKSNASEVAQYMKNKGSATAFPAPSIPRCGITVLRADTQSVQQSISSYLTLMTGQDGWDVIF